jgi:hypothetical protein
LGSKKGHKIAEVHLGAEEVQKVLIEQLRRCFVVDLPATAVPPSAEEAKRLHVLLWILDCFSIAMGRQFITEPLAEIMKNINARIDQRQTSLKAQIASLENKRADCLAELPTLDRGWHRA